MNAFLKPAVNSTTEALDDLAIRWSRAKAAEQAANKDRLAVEAEIAKLVGVAEEGTTNAETEAFKIKTVGKLTRSLDSDALQTDWEALPEAIQKCFSWDAKLDTKAFRALESMRDDLIPTISKYITTKPAKASISVEAK